MRLIETTDDLNAFCQQLQQHPFITVDLEFLREKTYYAKLCLIQIGSLTECAVIDPLAPEIDLQSFFELLQNPDITKVFHSGRQDLKFFIF
jgi:ribonuclease D